MPHNFCRAVPRQQHPRFLQPLHEAVEASLLLQERLIELTPAELSGHALGLNGSGMLAMQGIGAAIAGTLAQQTTPATAMTVMAVLSVAVTLALAPGLRPPKRPPP